MKEELTECYLVNLSVDKVRQEQTASRQNKLEESTYEALRSSPVGNSKNSFARPQSAPDAGFLSNMIKVSGIFVLH